MQITDDLPQFLSIFPAEMQENVGRCARDTQDDLIEVVLDFGRQPVVRFRQLSYTLEGRVSRDELNYVVEHVGDFADDNRAGIEGTLHRISAIRNRRGEIIGLTCRVGRCPTYADSFGYGCLLTDTEAISKFLDTHGTYRISNTETGMVYIGSSIHVRTRLQQHIRQLRKGEHDNKHLQSSYNLRGATTFVAAVIDYYGSEGAARDAERLRISGRRNQYNMDTAVRATVRTHSRGYVPTPEHREKISLAKKGWSPPEETRQRMSAAGRGRAAVTDETRKKHSVASSGRKHSEETRAKLSQIARLHGEARLSAARRANVAAYPALRGPDGTIYPQGVNVSEFCRNHSLHQSRISKLIRGLCRSHKGFTVA